MALQVFRSNYLDVLTKILLNSAFSFGGSGLEEGIFASNLNVLIKSLSKFI